MNMPECTCENQRVKPSLTVFMLLAGEEYHSSLGLRPNGGLFWYTTDVIVALSYVTLSAIKVNILVSYLLL